MSVLLIVVLKCTPAHACCPQVSHGEYADGTDRQADRQTDGHQAVALRFSLDVASVNLHP